MRPLRIAILWHQHQPYYKKNEEFILPWVRLHGVKDYFDLPEILHSFPDIKQTFNLAPSLALQLEQYKSGTTIDNIQKLSRIPANHLADEQKSEILRLFFLCNTENMIMPYPRYRELYERSRDRDSAMRQFDKDDWRDLQTWYNLTWIGYYSRKRNFIERFFRKGRNFTEAEKHIVLSYHLEILGDVLPQMLNLMRLGQIEISCSPMYHPILPLLCDSSSIREAMPAAQLPDKIFKYPEDARRQASNAADYYESKFHTRPTGMWPSEGSVSDEALMIIAREGIRWAASDEDVLEASRGDDYIATQKYFPHLFENDGRKISLLFRDRFLSDRIGFVYSQWNPVDAAGDFCNHLNNIKNHIVDAHGEDALEDAVVPVILDGENCWEFYRDNGVPFLSELFTRLSNKNEFLTITCAEAADPRHCNRFPPLNHIRAGSWIDANFEVWLGNQPNRMAWSILAQCREDIESQKENIEPADYKEALDEMMIAEGSDWFWWYCDRHTAENKPDFDVLYRWHINNIYKTIGVEPPEAIASPLGREKKEGALKMPLESISPIIGRDEGWDNGGEFDAARSMSEMHQVGGFLSRVLFGSDEDNIYIRLDYEDEMDEQDVAEIKIKSPVEFTVRFRKNSFELFGADKLKIYSMQVSAGSNSQFALSKKAWQTEAGEDKIRLQLSLRTLSDRAEIFYPRQGNIELEL